MLRHTLKHTEPAELPPSSILDIFRNFGKWWNTCLMNSKGSSFGDAISDPGKGAKRAASKVYFKISDGKVELGINSSL